ncbi:MAG: lipase family protein [Spirochaetia bacterium]
MILRVLVILSLIFGFVPAFAQEEPPGEGTTEQVTESPADFESASDGIPPGTILEITATGIPDPDRIRREGLPLFNDFVIPSAKYEVETYRIVYRSTDFDGTPADIVAQIFIPRFDEREERPVYVFGSGTTGIADKCAPSLERPDIRRLGYYRANMLAYAGLGFISIIPDYLGFNDPGRDQRYFVKAAEGHVMLDAIRAVYDFFQRRTMTVRPSDEVFVAGDSQGGHAAFAAADMWKDYAPEVPLTGVIGYGATTDVTALLKEGPKYAPHVLYSYSQVYDDIDPADYLKEKWVETLAADVAGMDVVDFQLFYPADSTMLYNEDFYTALYGNRLDEEFPALYKRLEENRSGLSGHGLPSLIVQGQKDTIARTPSQTKFVVELCRRDSPVRYLNIKGVTHRDTRAAGFQPTVLWMQRIISGEEPESDCEIIQ